MRCKKVALLGCLLVEKKEGRKTDFRFSALADSYTFVPPTGVDVFCAKWKKIVSLHSKQNRNKNIGQINSI